MKRKLFKRIIASLLVICMSISLMPLTAVSEVAETTSDLEDLIAGAVSVEDVYGKLDSETVPEIIGYEYAVSKTHVQRLYNEEADDLNRIVFLNADGTQTAYIFDFPVKYIDDEGAIKDITLDIADSSVAGQFETAGGSSVTTFSRNISDGIGLVGNDTELSLVPHIPVAMSSNTRSSASKITAVSTAKRIDNKTVAYEYDNKTTIEYSLTYTGFKEDIVVCEYTGQTEYDFTLYTNGLKLTEIDGSFYLVDEDNVIKATLGDIIIFTADEKNNTLGELNAQTIVENQEYLLTIVVDPEFLAAEETVYPIRIDPTVEICYDNNGEGAISDITVNSNSGSSATSGSLFVGLRETYGISRILMKFPGLNSFEENVSITNATVELRDLMCEGTELEVSCYVFSGNEWDESTADWTNVNPNSFSTFLSSNVISHANGTQQATAHRYSFDITKAVEGWRTGTCNPEKGIIFKGETSVENGSANNYKTIASYNRASYKPSLSITYETASNLLSDNTYYLNNRYCGDYLQYASSSATAMSGLISSLGDSIRWEIRSVDGGYAIRSSTDTTKYLGVSERSNTSTSEVAAIEIVTVTDTIIPQRCVWSIRIANGGGCLIKNTYNSRYLYSYGTNVNTVQGTGVVGSTYDTRVWRIASTSYYGNTSDSAKRELISTTYINNIEGAKDASVSINVDTYYDEIWASPSDFTYRFGENGFASYSNGKMTLLQYGGTKVEATHKVTGRVKSFYIMVGFSSTISSTPLAQNIVDGLNEPYDVWPASEESRYYYSSLNRAEALATIYETAMITIVGGWVVQNPDASSMLSHFLDNEGTRYDVGMKQMLSEWDTAREFRERDMDYVMRAVEASASYSIKTFRTITSLGCTVNEGTNWGRAVGSYTTSIVCTYKKTSATSYTMQITYELHDVYDWDRTITSMGNLPVSPRDMWELHHGGMAKNYEVYGKNTFTLSWTGGQTFGEGAVLSNET